MLFKYFAFAFFALCAATLAHLYPPIYFHQGGSDASNYVNLSLRLALGHQSAVRFYPPGFVAEQLEILDSALMKHDPGFGMLGMMAPFTFVSPEYKILWPHFHLYSFCGALLRAAKLDSAAEYLNYGALLASCCLCYLIARFHGVSQLISLVAGGLILLIPSYVMGARYPLSEALTTALAFGVVYYAVARQRFWEWHVGVLIALLSWCRAEFIPVAVLFLVYLGFRRERGLLYLALVLSASLLGMERYYLFATAGHVGFVRILLAIGRFGVLFFVLGWLLAQTPIPALLKRSRAELLRSRWVVPLSIITGIVLILGIDFVKMVVCSGEGCFIFAAARYSTIKLLIDSVGAPILIMSIIGFVARGRSILTQTPPILLLITLPLFLVFLTMNSTPLNVWYWTRRFHYFVYPLVILGCVNFLLLIEAHASQLRGPLARHLLVPSIVLLFVVLPRIPALAAMPEPPQTEEYVDLLHRSAEHFPVGAIVLLEYRAPVLVLQQPLRAFHGLWSYLVWDESNIAEAIRVLKATGRPVFVTMEQYQKWFPSDPPSKFSIEIPIILPDGARGSVHFVGINSVRRTELVREALIKFGFKS